MLDKVAAFEGDSTMTKILPLSAAFSKILRGLVAALLFLFFAAVMPLSSDLLLLADLVEVVFLATDFFDVGIVITPVKNFF